MDYVLKGLLANNIVEIGYASKYGFPTMGVFSTNLSFIEEEIRSTPNPINKGDFFEAFDFARKKFVCLDNWSDIISIKVYNPDGTAPSDLVAGESSPDKSARDEVIDGFIEGTAPSRFLSKIGSLPRPDVELFCSFFLTEDFGDLTDSEMFECFEDLRFSYLLRLEVWLGNYERFFGVNFDEPATREKIDSAAERWFSLISAYGKLVIMELMDIDEQDAGIDELIEEIENFKFPKGGYFPEYRDIVDYWPYLFNPRPSELPASIAFDA